MSAAEPPMVVGVDEAGRGALAGPVVAAAVMLGTARVEGLADSKKLGAKRRDELEKEVIRECITYHVASASVREIDDAHILEATIAAMQRAVAGIVIVPDLVLVDGDRLPELPYPARCVVGGDAKVPEIMAASILAKCARDRMMLELDRVTPGYGFACHKGYPTKDHVAALKRLGASPHHRRGFAPVARTLSGEG